MTPKEAATWQQLTLAASRLDAANDTLKYLAFEKLTVAGVARCRQIADALTYVQGTLELLAGDLDEERFPFREYQVLGPERQGSWEG